MLAASLALAWSVVSVAGQPTVGCPSGEVVVIDFSTAEINDEGTVVTQTVSADGVSFIFAVGSVLPNDTAGKVALYDTSAGTGVDPDLDVADVGEAVVVQQDGAMVPNDRGMGGTLIFAFGVPSSVLLSILNIKLLDIEVDTVVRYLEELRARMSAADRDLRKYGQRCESSRQRRRRRQRPGRHTHGRCCGCHECALRRVGSCR